MLTTDKQNRLVRLPLSRPQQRTQSTQISERISVTLDEHHPTATRPSRNHQTPKRDIHCAQDCIYDFLLWMVKTWSSDKVLNEFKQLFIYYCEVTELEVLKALGDIIYGNDEIEFRNTLKRACYILINNWDSARNYSAIQTLVELLSDPSISRKTVSPTLGRLRAWLRNFVNSKDYQEIKLFVQKFNITTEVEEPAHWSERYASYLLVPQYVNPENSVEQRAAARERSQQLKKQFKFNLAMYVARSQSAVPKDRPLPNPTALGDEVLRLIKRIVARRGTFSYANLANIFLKQTDGLPYQEFKQSLQKYLIFSTSSREHANSLNLKLSKKLNELYVEYEDQPVDKALVLRTCNRVIECLTTEDRQHPSELFILLLSQGNPLTLVITLLKLILICRNSRTHLESRIAMLISYYEQYAQEDCQFIVNFMEIFNITFAIYAENVEYNLVSMNGEASQSKTDAASYRVFSQQLRRVQVEAESPDAALEEGESSIADDL